MTTLPHTFKRIRLNLARSKEFPTGSSLHGYEFVAPLDGEGRIDLAAWKANREHCRVRRYWAGEDDEVGLLVHKSGGANGHWMFDYDVADDADDESGFRFAAHAFRPGEYVSIRGNDGEMHTYRVASVESAA